MNDCEYVNNIRPEQIDTLIKQMEYNISSLEFLKPKLLIECNDIYGTLCTLTNDTTKLIITELKDKI